MDAREGGVVEGRLQAWSEISRFVSLHTRSLDFKIEQSRFSPGRNKTARDILHALDKCERYTKQLTGFVGDRREEDVDNWQRLVMGTGNTRQMLLATRVNVLGFSSRVQVCLSRMGVKTLRDLVSCTAIELLERYSFGSASLLQVRDLLSRYELALRDEQWVGMTDVASEERGESNG